MNIKSVANEKQTPEHMESIKTRQTNLLNHYLIKPVNDIISEWISLIACINTLKY